MYTPEQVEDQAERVGIVSENCTLTRDMLRAYAATLKAAQGGVTEAMVDHYLAAQKETIARLDRQWGTHCGGSDFVREACRAGLEAALSAEPAAQGNDEQVPATAAPKVIAEFLRFVGLLLDSVKQSKTNPNASFVDWRDVCAMKGDLPYVRAALTTLTAPPAQPAERVPESYEDAQRQVMDAAQQWWRIAQGNGVPGAVKWLRNDETGSVLIYTRGEYADRLIGFVSSLTATPAAPAEEGDGKEGVR